MKQALAYLKMKMYKNWRVSNHALADSYLQLLSFAGKRSRQPLAYRVWRNGNINVHFAKLGFLRFTGMCVTSTTGYNLMYLYSFNHTIQVYSRYHHVLLQYIRKSNLEAILKKYASVDSSILHTGLLFTQFWFYLSSNSRRKHMLASFDI